jgi:hypothetical protein
MLLRMGFNNPIVLKLHVAVQVFSSMLFLVAAGLGKGELRRLNIV